jgi:hypothetical protein
MIDKDFSGGLSELGFDGGWVLSEGDWPDCVVLWEHDTAIPSEAEVRKAAKLFAENEKKAESDKAKSREALLKRLGLTQDEFQTLIDG